MLYEQYLRYKAPLKFVFNFFNLLDVVVYVPHGNASISKDRIDWAYEKYNDILT